MPILQHQTTLTAGTVMDRSRTPLAKWAAAIELLTSTDGVNAAQLSDRVGISHKTAWIMLRKFRSAISELDAGRKLQGTVRAGVRSLGRYLYVPHIRYAKEQVVIIGASMGVRTGDPTALKMRIAPPEHLEEKRLTRHGKAAFLANHVHPQAGDAAMLLHFDMVSSPIRHRFDEAAAWLNRLFHGLGPAYLQTYLDEYCFRWNAASHRLSLRDEWYKICFRSRPGSMEMPMK